MDRPQKPTAAEIGGREARSLAAELGFTLTLEPVQSKKPGLRRIVVTGHGKTFQSITWPPVIAWLRKQAGLLRLEAEARARAIARGR